jgi:SiaC family regulatory phosphoprotein
MSKLTILPTKDTPEINFDLEQGLFSISGRSFPNDTIEFFSGPLSLVDQYLLQPKAKTKLTFQIDYYNSTSLKIILNIIAMLITLHPQKSEVEIVWQYFADDEDMEETGTTISQLVGFPIQVLSM